MPQRRTRSSLAAPMLLTLTAALTACGGSTTDGVADGATATVEDFCAAAVPDPSDLAGSGADGAATYLGDTADALAEVGAPEELSEEGRRGLEIFVDTLQSASDDGLESVVDLTDVLIEELSAEEMEAVSAFNGETAQLCLDASLDNAPGISEDMLDDLEEDLGE